MRGVATDIGTIHFVGIGGIGMSGIAEVMKNLGYRVQGSDMMEGYVVERLREKNIPVAIGHSADNLGDAAVVVTSTAIARGNPEVEAALSARVPVVRRAEMLAELMRLKSTVAVAGTHGKTTTTSMIAAVLDAGGIDPTVINGGVINSYGSNARLGASDWMVVEADESDGSFLRLDGTIAVVTNIDPEHLDHYGSFDAVKDAFVEFVENVPFYGAAILCLDHAEVQNIIPRVRDRRVVTYGFAAQADVRGMNVTPHPGGNRFDAIVRGRDGAARSIEGIDLPMPGRHNVQNALAAITVALEMGIDDATIQRGFAKFGGVKRRFTKVGGLAFEGGGRAIVIDDYAHHPVEIRAVLSAARESAQSMDSGGRVIAVVQPHRYSRLGELMEDFQTAFNDADIVLVTPVYAAGETPLPGVDADALVEGLKRRGHRSAAAVADASALATVLADTLREGDQVVCLGAGDITKWAAGLADAIETRRDPFYVSPEELRISRPPGMYGFIEWNGSLKAGASLADFIWFRTGGPAQWMIRPEDPRALAHALEAIELDVPVLPVGVGSNLIVRDGGVPGVVVRLPKAMAKVSIDVGARGPWRVRAGAGAMGITVASAARDAGIAGLEFLRGIPGTVGGAIRMNAGAYGRDVSDILVEATIVTREGDIESWPLGRLGYTYRHSEVPEGAVVVEAVFEGAPGDKALIGAEMDRIAAEREASQPLRSRTGGSTFKNPPGDKAWRLIDAAGCRGLRRGDAQVSEKHCNFLLNLGGASSADIEALGEDVRERVKAHSGVMLEWEIQRVGVA